jgi:hypothetical protein
VRPAVSFEATPPEADSLARSRGRHSRGDAGKLVPIT